MSLVLEDLGQKHEEAHPRCACFLAQDRGWTHLCIQLADTQIQHTHGQGLKHHSSFYLCGVAWELSSTQQHPAVPIMALMSHAVSGPESKQDPGLPIQHAFLLPSP